MVTPTDWDKTEDWFWEGNVQEKIVQYMKDTEGFGIIETSDTRKKKPGPDILGERNGVKRHVSVKGFPSKYYTSDFPGGKKGERKRTLSSNQARKWFSQALFQLILAKNDNISIEIALGLPKFETYLNLLKRIEWFREKVNLYCYLVYENGMVETT